MRINPLTREVTMTEEECHKRIADDSKMVEDDFEKEYMAFMNSEEFLNAGNKKAYMLARHFAEWQRKQDQETIELAEDHAMLAGMNKEREELMKGAVEGEVYKNGSEYFVASDFFPIIYGIKDKQKVKLIIIPNDEQTN